ncbi:MAG: hypothetical protein CME69_11385 [Halobacteriovorax sp.]|nr:hypothetical protein [Halobacteriovorax sp.]|tara:strand:+ start:1089 stop:2150 length:1062 start_codon:yes stop_codon:yes gene_type:complete
MPYFTILFFLLFSCAQHISRLPSDNGDNNCANAVTNIYRSHSNYTNRIQVSPNSHGARLPGYEAKMKKIFSYVPSIKRFVKEYKAENQTTPLNKEVLAYLVTANKKVISELSSLKAHHPDITKVIQRAREGIDYNEKQLEKLRSFKSEHRDFLSRRYDESNKRDKNTFRPYKKEFYGVLGEIDVFMKIEGSEGIGIHFDNRLDELVPNERTHNRLLFEAVNDAENRLRGISPEAFNNLRQRYPLIFDRGGDNLEERIERSVSWMRSKEIDIVASKQGQKFLIEVKNYSKVITKNSLNDDYGGRKKSIFTQQKELVELIEYLDLPYRPMIVFRRGITEEAAQDLENIGFQVIGK